MAEVEDAGIGRAAGDDELGLMLARQGGDLFEIDAPVVLADAVLHGVEPFSRLVGRGAMGEMAARGQGQAENGVAGLQQRHENPLVRLSA